MAGLSFTLTVYRSILALGILTAILMGRSTLSHGRSLVKHIPTDITATSKFEVLRNLDLKKGDAHNSLRDIKLYMAALGYLLLPVPNLSLNPTELEVFDEGLEIAVRVYQRSFNLSVSGLLDKPTLDSLLVPRCGREDVRDGVALMLRKPRKDEVSWEWESQEWNVILGPRIWRTTRNLTYAFSSTIVNAESRILSKNDVRSAVASAFRTWADVVSLDFTETENFQEADIKIEFVGGDHGDGTPFDGPLGVLSHAFAPEDGRFHLDTAELWTVDPEMRSESRAIDLETVTLHEIGHLIGLDHSNVEESVMFPNIKTRYRRRFLDQDDIQGARALYGIRIPSLTPPQSNDNSQQKPHHHKHHLENSRSRRHEVVGWASLAFVLVLFVL